MPDLLYVESLAAPHTVNTMPEKTLLALADHGEIDAMLPHDGGDAEDVLGRFTQAGVDLDALHEAPAGSRRGVRQILGRASRRYCGEKRPAREGRLIRRRRHGDCPDSAHRAAGMAGPHRGYFCGTRDSGEK